MANKMNAAKKRVQKNDKSRFERIVRHRQALEREKYVEKAVARTCNIYFICAIAALIFAVATAIWVFISSTRSMLFLGMNLSVSLVFVPLCLYQYNQYHHVAEEVANARLSNGFRFPEDYTPRTRQIRERVSMPMKHYSSQAVVYGAGVLVAIGVMIYLYTSGAFTDVSVKSLMFAVAIIIAGVVLLVFFLMNFLNYLDARSLVKELIRIEEEAEVEFSEQLKKHAPKQTSAEEDDGDAAEDEADDAEALAQEADAANDASAAADAEAASKDVARIDAAE